MGVIVVLHHGADPMHVTLIFALALLFGIAMTLPIGGADMPVVISLYNALTGLAVAFEGFVLDNAAMIIAGTVVGSAGTLLTQLMAKAMNRSLANVLFSDFGSGGGATATAVTGSMKPIEASDVGVMMAFAQKVIVVPGYGMAVAQAQHKVWEMCQLLIERGVQVKFAIHPVAGRMPGHMNVLLAEAGVPYDLISDLDEINAEFETADVALIIGANDVVNPVARTDKSSPIYGMPILNADKAKNVIVIKRGQGAGFSGIENAPVLPRQHAHVVRRRAEGRGRARQRHQGSGISTGGGSPPPFPDRATSRHCVDSRGAVARVTQWLRTFQPLPMKVDSREKLRVVAGALLGIGITAVLSHLFAGGDMSPWLIAPMGASAVLVFGVPAKPDGAALVGGRRQYGIADSSAWPACIVYTRRASGCRGRPCRWRSPPCSCSAACTHPVAPARCSRC